MLHTLVICGYSFGVNLKLKVKSQLEIKKERSYGFYNDRGKQNLPYVQSIVGYYPKVTYWDLLVNTNLFGKLQVKHFQQSWFRYLRIKHVYRNLYVSFDK